MWKYSPMPVLHWGAATGQQMRCLVKVPLAKSLYSLHVRSKVRKSLSTHKSMPWKSCWSSLWIKEVSKRRAARFRFFQWWTIRISSSTWSRLKTIDTCTSSLNWWNLLDPCLRSWKKRRRLVKTQISPFSQSMMSEQYSEKFYQGSCIFTKMVSFIGTSNLATYW